MAGQLIGGSGFMEPKHIKKAKSFESERYKPFCIDPTTGKHQVYDSRGYNREAEAFTGSFDAVARECKRLNDEAFLAYRRRR